MSQLDVATLVSKLDYARAGLYELLRSKDLEALAKRPASDEWSIIENGRHLLWAEQPHLGKFLPDGFEWSCVGLTQKTGRAYAEVGKNPTDDLEEIFQAWDAVHVPIREAVKGGGEEVQEALDRHLKDLAYHIDIIEKLLSESNA